MFIIIFSFISLAVADHCLKDPSVQRIYEVINELQKHRHRRYQSQIQQLYDEQVWEIYEEDLENQIRRNRIEIERTQLMIEKYFLQRRACIEKLLDFLQSVDQGFNANSNETESLNTYFYSVEQFIFAQSCYEVIQQNTEIDIELMSKEELEKFEIFQQYYDNYNLGQDRLKTKLSVETATIDFRLKWDSFQEVFADDPERLQEMLAKLFWNSRQAYGRLKDTLQAEYEQAISSVVDDNRCTLDAEAQGGHGKGEGDVLEAANPVQPGGPADGDPPALPTARDVG